MNTCTTCGHDTKHTPLVGCLEIDCDCTEELAWTKTLEQARQERDASLDQVERGTDPDWANQAEAVVLDLAARERDGYAGEFSGDEVWHALKAREVPAPREPRALGPILKRLTNAGKITPSGFKESTRRKGSPVRTYNAGPNL